MNNMNQYTHKLLNINTILLLLCFQAPVPLTESAVCQNLFYPSDTQINAKKKKIKYGTMQMFLYVFSILNQCDCTVWQYCTKHVDKDTFFCSLLSFLESKWCNQLQLPCIVLNSWVTNRYNNINLIVSNFHWNLY